MSTAKYLISGQSNRVDAFNLPMSPDSRTPLFTEWARLANVDVDDFGGCALRKGYIAATAGNGVHSLWSNPLHPTDGYFVEQGTLKVRRADGIVIPLRSGLTLGMRMFYCQVNNVVAYSNGMERGIIEDYIDCGPFVPTDEFKLPFPAGRCLEWHNGRLYTGIEENGAYALVCSDSLDTPGGVESMDDRQCNVAQFDGPITMIQHVEAPGGTGLFIGAGGATFYLPGSDPVAAEDMGEYQVDRYGAVLGSNVPVQAGLVGKGGTGFGAFWVAGDRVCYGAPSGEVVALDKLAVPVATEGTGMIREANGAAHYVFTLSGIGGTANTFEPWQIDEQ
jgi:hypothetical protein